MEAENNKNHHYIIRILLWSIVVLGIAAIGYFASDNNLFKADLLQKDEPPTNSSEYLYIPDNYKATSPQSTNTVAIKAGQSINAIGSVEAHFLYNPDQITFALTPEHQGCMNFVGTKIVTPFINVCSITPDQGDGKSRLDVQIAITSPVSGVDLVPDDKLFKLQFSINGGLEDGELINIENIFLDLRDVADEAIDPPTHIANGRIVIVEADEEEDLCAVEGEEDCHGYGDCDPNSGCDCYNGYGGPLCGTCADGYTGYPNCVLNAFGDLISISLEVEEYPGEAAVTVHPTDSLGLIATGTFDDGAGGTAEQVLNFRDVMWVAEPVNRLNDAALAAGRLERGDVPGMAEVFVEAQRPDDSIVRSNTISVNVPAGPIIEYARIIGSATEERGGRFNLSVKVSDADEVTDIQDMRTLIVRSGFDTYNEINNDPNKVVFTTDPFTANEVAAINDDAQEGEEQGNLQYFKVYSINVDVPENGQLTDGAYKLLLEITDTEGRLATAVLPIYIGAPATGDVSGDNQLTPLDVALAFQIANGEVNPTANQFQAANMDGLGGVTLFDVVLLFHQVTQQN